MSAILSDLIETDFSSVLILSGAGVEPDFQLTVTHALVAYMLSHNGRCITTNVSPLLNLVIPHAQPPVSFIAVHSLLTDVTQGRGGARISHHRLRSSICTSIPDSFKKNEWFGSRCPIPITIQEDDVNFVEACQLAKSGALKILIVIGQSLDKTTNGRGLNWLRDAHSIERVIYVNPDLTATDDIVCGK
jgi:hypothetical protein